MVFDGSISACIPKAACNQVMTSPYDATGSVGNNDIENTKLTENGKYDISVCYTNRNIFFHKTVILLDQKKTLQVLRI